MQLVKAIGLSTLGMSTMLVALSCTANSPSRSMVVRRSASFSTSGNGKCLRPEEGIGERHTTCNRCGRRGHWARERRSKDTRKGQGKGTDKGSSASGAAPSGAAVVEELDFVAAVMASPTPLEQARSRFGQSSPTEKSTTPDEVLLVSSPGFGVID